MKDNQQESVLLSNGEYAKIRRVEVGKQARISIQLSYLGVYGMGEKFNKLNQKGETVTNQVIEKFCNQGELTYCSIPFFVTDSGLGVYIATKEKTEFRFQEEITCLIPQKAEVIIFNGTVKECISKYIQLFGEMRIPPKYAFGPWISANRWNTQKMIEEQMLCLEKYDFPANVLVIEAWSDEANFYIWNGARYQVRQEGPSLRYEDFDFSQSEYWTNPKEMIEQLHKKEIRLVLWQIPVYKKQDPTEEKNAQLEADKREALEKALCVQNADGTPYEIPEGNWFAGSYIPDFTNQKTKEVWFDKRKYLLEIGVDGFKTDGGEFIYREDVQFSNGESGKEGKNQYAQEYVNAYTEFIGRENVLFSRAGFTGAHKTPILWAGDQQSTNEEMRSVLRAGLSAAMSGISFWGFDIGGFAGGLPTLDVYRRSTQMACFSPIMQWHSEPDGGQFKELLPGMNGNNERSPWNIAHVHQAPAFVQEMRFWHKLRMNLIPYLYHEAIKSVNKNQPMMRPLIYEADAECNAVSIEDQYFLGGSLLVAPFLEENQGSRRVYLPKGIWFGFFSKERYEGEQWIQSDALEKVPVYIRGGTAVALQLDEKMQLGEFGGNQIDCTRGIHFILTGSSGRDTFQDEIHSFELSWQEKEVHMIGNAQVKVSWEVRS